MVIVTTFLFQGDGYHVSVRESADKAGFRDRKREQARKVLNTAYLYS